jgi:hypothetical protein|tara:strand:- start:1313 stop:1714 length:402 start_codon:yes stop_codon:yes gene_type:complete
MFKDKNGNFIGKGEYLVFEMLTTLFPDKEMKTQVKFIDLLTEEWADTVSERQEKETIDIVVFTDPILAVRVQDPHHSGEITAQRDLVQKKTLEWNGLRVIDIQHYNCPNIMKEKPNKESMRELVEALNHEGIH